MATKKSGLKIYVPLGTKGIPLGLIFISRQRAAKISDEIGVEPFGTWPIKSVQVVSKIQNSEKVVERLKNLENLPPALDFQRKAVIAEITKSKEDIRIALESLDKLPQNYGGKMRELQSKLYRETLTSDDRLQTKINRIVDLVGTKDLVWGIEHSRWNHDYWPLPETNSYLPFIRGPFTEEINKREIKIPYWNEETLEYRTLNPFQVYVSNLMSEFTPYSGILLFHGLGSGKTASSISIRNGYPNRKACILLPASLETNYRREIKKFGNPYLNEDNCWKWVGIPASMSNEPLIDIGLKSGMSLELLQLLLHEMYPINGRLERGFWLRDPKEPPNFNMLSEDAQKSIKKQIDICTDYEYTFVHLNAGAALLPQLWFKMLGAEKYRNGLRNGLGEERANIRKALNIRERYQVHNWFMQNQMNCFDYIVLCIDEVHNLISRIVNGSLDARMLYETIVRAKDIKVVAMSGTPLINSGLEAGVLLNILFQGSQVVRCGVQKSRGTWDQGGEISRNFKDNLGDLWREWSVDSVKKEWNAIQLPNGWKKIKDNNDIITKSLTNPVEQTIQAIEEKSYSVSNGPLYQVSERFPLYLSDAELISGSILLSPKAVKQSVETFESNYIDYETFKLKDKLGMMSRALGGISYFHEVVGKDKDGYSIFPTLLEPISHEVPFSDYQFFIYHEAREAEREDERRKAGGEDGAQGAIEQGVSQKQEGLYKMLSRQRSLFVFPPGVPRPSAKEFRKARKLQEISEEQTGSPMRDEKDLSLEPTSYDEALEKAINTLSNEHLTTNSNQNTELFNLSVLSPKMQKGLEIIKESPGTVLVYSQFRKAEGIGLFARIMEANGFHKFHPGLAYHRLRIGDMVKILIDEKDPTIGPLEITKVTAREPEGWRCSNGHVYPAERLRRATYALWTGTESPKEREHILNSVNARSNTRGQDIHVICITAAGAEGISLRNIRTVLIMEAYWNKVRTNQVIGRARRILSHTDLQPDERNVQVHELYSVATKEQLSGQWGYFFNDLDPSLFVEQEEIEEPKEDGENNGENNGEQQIEKLKKRLDPTQESIRKDISRQYKDTDHSLSSDQVLREISVKKDSIVQDFQNTFKVVAVDCVFNRRNNLEAEPKLSELKCLEVGSIPITDGKTFTILNRSAVAFAKPKVIKRQTISIPFLPVNMGKIPFRVLIFTTKETKDLTKLLSDSESVDAYDMYSFFGLRKGIAPKTEELIGTFKGTKLNSIKDRVWMLKTISLEKKLIRAIAKRGFPPKTKFEQLPEQEQVAIREILTM